MDEDGGEAELLSGVLSLSLTEAHGDPKVWGVEAKCTPRLSIDT